MRSSASFPGRGKDAIKQRCKELGCGIKAINAGRLWTADEIAALHAALLPFEGQKKKNWAKIAVQVPDRTAEECRMRYYNQNGVDRNP